MLFMLLQFLMTTIDSIPHASSSGNSLNNGQKPISISPTNSTSPVGKESGLANDENTIPKPCGSGEEPVVDTILKSGSLEESVAGSGLANVENTILKYKQPGSLEESVPGSGLANVENNILKYKQPGSVEETVAGSRLANDEDTIPKSEQPGSVEETVVESGEETVIKTAETTENETTGQGPTR